MKSSRRFVVILPLLLAALNLPALALEGYYTEEEVRTPAPGEPGDWTYIRKSWYSDQRMRKEEEWLGITIARFDKDLIYVLEPTIKTYFEVTPETLRKHAESQLKLFGAQEDAQGKPYFPADLFVRTGTTKKIGRWSAYQVMTNPKYRRPEIPYMVIWYSTEINFPVKLFGDQLRNFFGNSPEAEGLFQRLTQFFQDIDGFGI